MVREEEFERSSVKLTSLVKTAHSMYSGGAITQKQVAAEAFDLDVVELLDIARASAGQVVYVDDRPMFIRACRPRADLRRARIPWNRVRTEPRLGKR